MVSRSVNSSGDQSKSTYGLSRLRVTFIEKLIQISKYCFSNSAKWILYFQATIRPKL